MVAAPQSSPATMAALEALALLQGDNHILRERLEELETALAQAGRGGYAQIQQATSLLRSLCRFFQRQGQDRVRLEETLLYRLVEDRLPRLRGLVGELRSELGLFQEAFEGFRDALVLFNAAGEMGELSRRGQELAGLLKRHLNRLERELFPLVLRRLEGSAPSWRYQPRTRGESPASALPAPSLLPSL